MSIRTTYRICSHRGKPIPFNPTAGQFAHFYKSCLKSQVTIPRAPRRKP